MRKSVYLVAFMLLAALPAAGGERVIEDEWYLLTLMEKPAGSASIRVVEIETEKGKLIRTLVKESISFRAGPAKISMDTSIEIRERPEGTPLSFVFTMDDGKEKKVKRGRFEPGKLYVWYGEAMPESVKPISIPDDFVFGYAEERLVRSKGVAPGTRYSYTTYDPQVGKVKVTREVGNAVSLMLPVSGRIANLHPIEVNGLIPGMTVTEYLDHEGSMVYTEIPVAGFKMALEAMPREALEKHLGRPPELNFTRLRWVEVEFPHPRPRDVTEATFIISSTDGKPFEGLEMTDVGIRSKRLADGSIEVTICYPEKDLAGRRAPPSPPDKVLLASGPYVMPDVPGLRQKAMDLAANSKTYLETARKMERWVRGHMQFLPVGENFASAERVWNSRRGDCTEAAVLLASLLRAAGIPCRLADGLAMLNGQMGFHMWVEVYGGERGEGKDVWIPFDSALYEPRQADATHLRFAAIEDDGRTLESVALLVQLIGRLKVKGKRYKAGDVVVKPGSRWWERDGNRLVHRGFLVSFPLPGGWRVKSEAPSGALRVEIPGDTGGTITVRCREVPYEDTFRSALAKIREGGFGITGAPEYGSVKGRRWMRLSAAKGKVYLRALYVRDGNYVIRFTADMSSGALLRSIRRGLEFLSGDGADAGE